MHVSIYRRNDKTQEKCTSFEFASHNNIGMSNGQFPIETSTLYSRIKLQLEFLFRHHLFKSILSLTWKSTCLQSLDVTWQPPPKDYRNGIITKYVISYQESGPRSFQSTLEVPGHILKKTINGLSKGKTYSITVSAATVQGNGPASGPVTGTVLLQSTNGNDVMLSSYVLEASHIKESLGYNNDIT